MPRYTRVLSRDNPYRALLINSIIISISIIVIVIVIAIVIVFNGIIINVTIEQSSSAAQTLTTLHSSVALLRVPIYATVHVALIQRKRVRRSEREGARESPLKVSARKREQSRSSLTSAANNAFFTSNFPNWG